MLYHENFNMYDDWFTDCNDYDYYRPKIYTKNDFNTFVFGEIKVYSATETYMNEYQYKRHMNMIVTSICTFRKGGKRLSIWLRF